MHAISELRKTSFRFYCFAISSVGLMFLGMGFLFSIYETQGDYSRSLQALFWAGILTGLVLAFSLYRIQWKAEKVVIWHATGRFSTKLREAGEALAKAGYPGPRQTALNMFLGSCVDALNAGVPLNEVNAMVGALHSDWCVRWNSSPDSVVTYYLCEIKGSAFHSISIK